MANATDNVYVNIIANTQGFTDKMRSALGPIREFTSMIRSVMALGGAAMVINKIVQAVGDMERAYAKLYPESQKAVGSITQWNTQMEGMKARAGGIVSSILSPIRQAFLDMIDPIGSATYELDQLGKSLKAIADKYLTTDRKAYESRQQALDDLTKSQTAFTKALNTQSFYQDKLNRAEAEHARLVELNKKTGGYGGSSLGAQIDAARKAADIAKEQYEKNEKLIVQSRTAIRNATEYLSELDKGSTAAVKKEAALKDVVLKTNEAYAARLETAQEYMDAMDRVYATEVALSGMKGSERGVKTARATGMKGGSEGKTHRISSWRMTPEDIAELTAEWQKYADLITTISASLGEAFVTGDYIAAIKQMTTALLDFIAKEAIAAGLDQILKGNVPFGIALLALGGVTLGVSAGVRAGGGGGGGGEGRIELPHMAAGGIVTRPTLAMIGEAGPEAVVPLGHGGGGTTIIVQGSIWQTEDLARAIAGAQARW